MHGSFASEQNLTCPFCGAPPFRRGARLYCNGNHDETHTRIEMFDFQWNARADLQPRPSATVATASDAIPIDTGAQT